MTGHYRSEHQRGAQKAIGGFRGRSWQQLPPPPLHDENSAWRPIFGKKGAPYPDPNALFFEFCSECGETYNLYGVIKLKNQIIFSEKRPRNFCAPSARLPFAVVLAPTLQFNVQLCFFQPRSTLGWIRPCRRQRSLPRSLKVLIKVLFSAQGSSR